MPSLMGMGGAPWWVSGGPYTHIYYVSTTGNDSTGNGSLATPWATIGKAVSMLVNGDLVLVADGTYSENNSGTYGTWAKTLTAYATIGALNGPGGNVIVKGTSHATYNVIMGGVYQKYKFITFTQRVSTTPYAIYVRNAMNNIYFDRCKFRGVTDGTTYSLGIYLSPPAGATVQNVTFDRCIFSSDNPNDTKHVSLGMNNQGGTGVITNIAINNCTFQAAGMYGIRAWWTSGAGTTDFVVDGGTFNNLVSASICVGVDGDTTGDETITATIRNCVAAQSASGHGILLGGHTANCVINNVSIPACYDIGVVLKSSTGHEVKNCTIVGGSTAAVMVKGSTGCNVHNNILSGACTGDGVLSAKQSGETYHFGTLTFQNNTVHAIGAGARCLSWTTDDLGSGVCDYNTYTKDVGGYVGNVRGTNNITTLVGLQGAWAGYDNPNNDANSTVA